MKRYTHNTHSLLSLTSGVSFATLVLAGFALTIPQTHAESAAASVDKVSVVIPLSCTMSGTVDTAHATDIIAGQKKTNIGETTLLAYCNDAQGFEIYAKGISSSVAGQETDLVSSLGSSYNIKTGTATSGAASSWGMKIVSGGGTYAPSVDAQTTNSDGYFAVPSSYTRVAYRQTATDGQGGTGSSIKTTYYVYAAGTQPAGTYTGKVSYAMFHPYSSPDAISLKKAFFLAEKETVTIDGAEYYKMQDMTPQICAAANVTGEASQVQLADVRDSKLYWVTKLDDGHCWMTQNLDFNIRAGVTLTSETTDLTSYGVGGYIASVEGGTQYGYQRDGDIIKWTPNRGTLNATGADGEEVIINNWQDEYTLPDSADVGDWYITNEEFESSECSSDACNYFNETTEYFSKTPYSNGMHGHVGNYYTWTAAIAANDSSAWSSSTASDVTNDPHNSICPANWRLPTAGNVNEYSTLNTEYNGGLTNNGFALMRQPLYFIRSGYVLSDGLHYAGYYGYVLSSTVNSGTNARRLIFRSDSVNVTRNANRYGGYSVRCVAR